MRTLGLVRRYVASAYRSYLSSSRRSRYCCSWAKGRSLRQSVFGQRICVLPSLTCKSTLSHGGEYAHTSAERYEPMQPVHSTCPHGCRTTTSSGTTSSKQMRQPDEDDVALAPVPAADGADAALATAETTAALAAAELAASAIRTTPELENTNAHVSRFFFDFLSLSPNIFFLAHLIKTTVLS